MRRFYLLLLSLSALSFYTLDAQSLRDPSSWASLVNNQTSTGKEVHAVFSFENTSNEQAPPDFVNYKAYHVVLASDVGLTAPDGNHIYKLSSEDYIVFKIDPEYRTKPNLFAEISVAGRSLSKGESLYRQGGGNKAIHTPESDCDYLNFGDKLTIGDNPVKLDLLNEEFLRLDAKTFSNRDAAYYIDNITLYTEQDEATPLYTRYVDSQWSHGYPTENQIALIDAPLTLANGASIKCKEIHISNHPLYCAEGASLETDHLVMHNGATFFSGGVVTIDYVSSVLKFPQKGKWYFYSLPFDLYKDGIIDYTWGDNQTKDGGNYLYAASYNSERRANEETNQGNWTVLRPNTHPVDMPLIKCGEGYLLAIDSEADSDQVLFTSKLGESFADFGRVSTINATCNISNNTQHEGWMLCANPLPTPLDLSQLAGDHIKDHCIYLYSEGRYEKHHLEGSQEQIAPNTAFFAQFTRDTNLSITPPKSLSPTLLTTKSVYNIHQIGPVNTEPLSDSLEQSWHIIGRTLYLDDIEENLTVKLFDTNGRLSQQGILDYQNNRLEFLAPEGFYLLHVSSPKSSSSKIIYLQD